MECEIRSGEKYSWISMVIRGHQEAEATLRGEGAVQGRKRSVALRGEGGYKRDDYGAYTIPAV
jgi:hypothetical protein